MKKKILIIDDNDLYRLNLKFQLKEIGVISEAHSQKEAMKMLQSNSFDLILCDIEMEESDSGLQIIKQNQPRIS